MASGKQGILDPIEKAYEEKLDEKQQLVFKNCATTTGCYSPDIYTVLYVFLLQRGFGGKYQYFMFLKDGLAQTKFPQNYSTYSMNR
jgi:hypothetical protein